MYKYHGICVMRLIVDENMRNNKVVFRIALKYHFAPICKSVVFPAKCFERRRLWKGYVFCGNVATIYL